MSATFRPLFAAALLTAALTACDDPYAVEPQFEVEADTFVVYGINEAPSGAPTAISLLAVIGGTPAVTATAAFQFDIAVDVNAAGQVVLIPNSQLAVPIVAPHRVGMQVVTGTYDALTRAPAGSYTYDSVFVVTPGQVVAIQSADPRACPIPAFGTSLHGKLVVDSVRLAPARVYFRSTIDPNCDFLSLIPGTPED